MSSAVGVAYLVLTLRMFRGRAKALSMRVV